MIKNAGLSKIDVRYVLRVPKTNYQYTTKKNWFNLFAYSMVLAVKKK